MAPARNLRYPMRLSFFHFPNPEADTDMHILRGAPVLSDFRRNKLLARLQQQVPGVSGVYAEFMHFADLIGELAEQDQAVLDRLLKYGPRVAVEEPTGTLVLVVPRFGTISPWSSKATDIAHNCGLSAIARLERGIAYYVDGELSAAELQQVTALLHDRMTELALDTVDAVAQLVHRTEPRPFNRVDSVEGGKAALEQASSELGVALAGDDIDYLVESFKGLGRNPSDVELMMFA